MTEPRDRARSSDEPLAPSQRRLQRPADFTGQRLRTFRAVLLRHGLPGAVLGALCLLHPQAGTLLDAALRGLLATPLSYIGFACLTFAGLVAYAWLIDRRLDPPAVGWILYLLAISTWEEWVFRVALPYLGEAQGIPLVAAVVVSNVAFGLMHYFTLRWKWPWCLAAALGGLALSRQFGDHADLAVIIGLHWVATFLNTPRPPGRSAAR
ncbi:MAG: CPBP family intramembrane metalloprotease [Gammaproteobacteria bacterium]|jgi:hypothetical protein|nr:CPBP family intramembrane metalloprotease [Gammaproteobacteria bacterium]